MLTLISRIDSLQFTTPMGNANANKRNPLTIILVWRRSTKASYILTVFTLPLSTTCISQTHWGAPHGAQDPDPMRISADRFASTRASWTVDPDLAWLFTACCVEPHANPHGSGSRGSGLSARVDRPIDMFWSKKWQQVDKKVTEWQPRQGW